MSSNKEIVKTNYAVSTWSIMQLLKTIIIMKTMW